MAQASALVLSNRGRSALVRVPFEHRAVVQALGWRKWNPSAKAWHILSADLPGLVDALERAGCMVRWRGGQR